MRARAENTASDAEEQVDQLSGCRDAARKLIISLNAPESPGKVDAIRQALTTMAEACR